MALYIPQSILHLARSLYVRPETYGPTYVHPTADSCTVTYHSTSILEISYYENAYFSYSNDLRSEA